MTDEERLFYELGKAYYYDRKYSLIKALSELGSPNRITIDELFRGEGETHGESNRKKGD